MRCEYGFCIVCDAEIAPKCGDCSTRKPGGNYTEVELKWSNGARMTTAVCIPCSKDQIWKADKTELTKAVWAAWDRQGHQYDKNIVIVD